MNEETLFDAVSALPPGAKRDAFLDRLCEGNPTLRARLRQRLAEVEFSFDTPGYGGPHGHGGIAPPIWPIRLDEYEILEEIGRGGMGIVYRARHCSLQRLVAVKVLQRAVLDERTQRRVRVEMAALGRLNHPNLLQAFDARRINGQNLIVTELVSGVSLDKLLDQVGKLSVAEACDYVRQAACGLSAAHQQGLIHRDIKPGNLMLEQPSETLKLLDFGLALLVSPGSVSLHGPTLPGQAIGTPCFMPPEQWHDAHLVCEKSDIYALGVTLYWLLAGEPPFLGGSMDELRQAHCHAPRPQIAGLEEDLNRLIRSMISVEPAHRPSAPDVVRALDRFCIGPVPSVLPPIIDKLERHGIAGRIGPEVDHLKKYLQRLPRRRVVTLFREAGQYLGRKGFVDGPERGLTALIQIFLETGDDNEAYELGVAILKESPGCFDALHLTAVAARQSAFSYGGDPEPRLREAIRLELAAQNTPSATLQSNYGPSLSVLAQVHQNLARHFRSRGAEAPARAALQESLTCYRKRLNLQETALGLALYAEALVDGNELRAARDAATRACELDWFLREAQQLVLDLAERIGDRLEPTEEHIRRWSIVAGEWPGSPAHRSQLIAYRGYLKKSHLWPELLAWESEPPTVDDPRLRAEISLASRGTVERQIHFDTAKTLSRNFPCQVAFHAMLWQFERPQPSVVAGIPKLRLFAIGHDQDSACDELEAMLFMIHERVGRSGHPETPLLVTVKHWFSDRIN